MMRRAPILLLATLLAFGGASATISGCSTSTTRRTVERPINGTATETTTTETHETNGPDVGIISGTIHAVGFILALPFKIVGGLIQLIF